MIDYISIGKQIKKRRNQLKLTQEVLAEKVYISIPHLSRIENGSSKPSLQTLVDLCNALDTTIDNLMQDSVPAAKRNIEGRMGELLEDCSLQELELLTEVAEVILKRTREQ